MERFFSRVSHSQSDTSSANIRFIPFLAPHFGHGMGLMYFSSFFSEGNHASQAWQILRYFMSILPMP